MQCAQAAAFDHLLDLRAQRLPRARLRLCVDQIQKATQGRRRTRRQRVGLHHLPRGTPQRHPQRFRRIAQLLKRFFAQSTRGRVHHPFERRIVIPMIHQPQIGQRVPNFRPIKKAQPAVHAVRQPRRNQRFFDHPRLRIGAVQHRAFAPIQTIGHRLRDLLHHEMRFIQLIEGQVIAQRRAPLARRPQILPEPPLIAGDDRVGRIQNRRGGTIILLQPHQMRVRKIPRKMLNMFDFRPAPTVNRLIVIAHRENPVIRANQQAHPGILQAVGVLKLINQHLPKPALIMRPQGVVIAQQLGRAQQQFREIHQAAALAQRLIRTINAEHRIVMAILSRLRARRHMRRPQALLLPMINQTRDHFRRPTGVIQIGFPQQPLHQAQLVIAI